MESLTNQHIISPRGNSDPSVLSNTSHRGHDTSPDVRHYDMIATPALKSCSKSDRTNSSCGDCGNRSEGHVVTVTDAQDIKTEGHVTRSGSIVNEMDSATLVYEASDQPEVNARKQANNDNNNSLFLSGQLEISAGKADHSDQSEVNTSKAGHIDQSKVSTGKHTHSNQSEISAWKPAYCDNVHSKEQNAEESKNVRTLENGDDTEKEEETPCDGEASFAISFSPLSVIPSDSDSDCEDPLCSGENVQKSSKQECATSQSSVSNGSYKTNRACSRGEGLMEETWNKMEVGEVTSDSELQTESHCIKEIGDELHTDMCVSVNMDSGCPPLTLENTSTDLKQEKKFVSEETSDATHFSDSDGTPCTNVNRDNEDGEPVTEAEIESLCVSQKRTGLHKNSEGFSQKSLGCLEFTPDSPSNLMNCSQPSSDKFSHRTPMNANSSANTGACHKNGKLSVFETSWSDDGSVFDVSPVRLNKHQSTENLSNSHHPDRGVMKNSPKCHQKIDAQNTMRQNIDNLKYYASSKSKNGLGGQQDSHGDPHCRWSEYESDQRWMDRESVTFDESSSESSVSSSPQCTTNTDNRANCLSNRTEDTRVYHLPDRARDIGADRLAERTQNRGTDHLPNRTRDRGTDCLPRKTQDRGIDRLPDRTQDMEADRTPCKFTFHSKFDVQLCQNLVELVL
jgi:hypothetical protein